MRTWSLRKAEFLSRIMSVLPLKFEYANYIFPIPSISFTFLVPEEYWFYFFILFYFFFFFARIMGGIMFFVVQVKLVLTLQATLNDMSKIISSKKTLDIIL